MISSRRKATARKNPPNTVEGNGFARSFRNHTDPNEPIEFRHGLDGFPSIIILDTDGVEYEYASLQDEAPRAGWAGFGESATDIFVKYLGRSVKVWTTLTSGVISLD